MFTLLRSLFTPNQFFCMFFFCCCLVCFWFQNMQMRCVLCCSINFSKRISSCLFPNLVRIVNILRTRPHPSPRCDLTPNVQMSQRNITNVRALPRFVLRSQKEQITKNPLYQDLFISFYHSSWRFFPPFHFGVYK